MLHEAIIDVKHKVFCGPRAIATLTGVPVSRIEAMIRRCRKGWARDRLGRKRPVQGTYHGEVLTVLKRLGCRVEKIASPEPTLSRFIDDTRTLSCACLVHVTDHYVTTWRGGSAGYHGNQRVIQAWRVYAPAQPKYTTGAPQRQRKPKAPRDVKAERYAKVLAAITRWESKEKRARTALRKLRKQQHYYERAGVTPASRHAAERHHGEGPGNAEPHHHDERQQQTVTDRHRCVPP